MQTQNGQLTVPATVGQAIEHCHQRLSDSDAFYGHGTDNPWDEAVQLVLALTDLPAHADEQVLPQSLSPVQWQAICDCLDRRINEHLPLPYLTGKAWFAGLEFKCDRRAIVPRSPIAELIVNHYAPWYAGPEPEQILDLCCGGGCIGLAAAHYAPRARVDLADIDAQALSLAGENLEKLGFGDRVTLIPSDLFAALDGRRYDLILSNPPYVDAADLATMPSEYHREPPRALGSGPDGLALSRKILAQAGNYLKEQGLLVLEVGNSWEALEAAYPTVPFTWLEFSQGGHGVCVLTAKELQDYRESLCR